MKKETGAKNLVILGDIKHNIPAIAMQEKYDVPNFFEELAPEFQKIVLIKGNHDGRIELMVHNKKVEIASELIVDGVIYDGIDSLMKFWISIKFSLTLCY